MEQISNFIESKDARIASVGTNVLHGTEKVSFKKISAMKLRHLQQQNRLV